MYGQKHPLAYQATQGEKIVWNFTLKQLGWLAAGVFLSIKFSQFVPPLPMESYVFKHLHHALPLALCGLCGFAGEGKTGLPLYTYFMYWIAFNRRRRTLIYKRGSGQ
ncbi:hypothetical protein DCCM_4601 [Desulfocucumis palustris]|uniref:Uncharacterized protein n=1 Tax=Desulfocucumis palustris TaxID=1898651 RepID=A0A2L2XH65_9FIRM|nr:PrgI family protein [Desulfocucumis palustris]GBF35472.1 hypothetical protein DCCM_4601 [Desulfocucumis palustris]